MGSLWFDLLFFNFEVRKVFDGTTLRSWYLSSWPGEHCGMEPDSWSSAHEGWTARDVLSAWVVGAGPRAAGLGAAAEPGFVKAKGAAAFPRDRVLTTREEVTWSEHWPSYWEGQSTPAAKAGKEWQNARGCERNHMGPPNIETHELVQGYCKTACPSSLHTEVCKESRQCSRETRQLFHRLLCTEGYSRNTFPSHLCPLSSPQFWPQRIRHWLASGWLY